MIRSHRPTLAGTRHMVAAGHYLASHAAFMILEAGGNAVDAGVAAGIALGVVQSDIVNVAGVAPIIVRVAQTRETLAISGLGWWPAATRPELFAREHGGRIPLGVLRTVVPAAPDAWILALERFGTMTFGEVAAAAIRFASDGFLMHSLMAGVIEENAAAYARWPSSAAIYLPGGRPPRPGELFVQRDVGRTLQYMADEEAPGRARGGRGAGLAAARRAFYAGDIARTIVDFQRSEGGWLSMADLAAYRSEVEATVPVRFAGWTIHLCQPWCQGPVLGQMLGILEAFDLAALGHNSDAYVHTLVEAMKLAFADREAHYGDPRFVRVPLDRLLAPGYARSRAALIRPDAAFPDMPSPGLGGEASAGAPRAPAPLALDTSYVCVVDRDGNVFSATPSDTSAEVPVVPGTGLCPSGRGSQSWADPRHASAAAPGKRPRLTPSPALAIGPDGCVMPFGTPGGDVQAQAMLQVFLNRAVFGMDLQSAVEAPRFATYSFPDSFEPHASFPGRLTVEARLVEALAPPLRRRGHRVETWDDWTWRAGGVCAIEARAGRLLGAADPRRQSYVLGW